MRKVWVVAAAEFASRVRSKAFLVSLVLMPVLMIGVQVTQHMLEGRVDTRPRRFAIVDWSHALYPALAARTEARNAAREQSAQRKRGARFEPESVPASGAADTIRLAQSQRIQRGELFAFVEIPEDVITAAAPALRYHSDSPTYDDLRQFLEQAVNEEVRERRYRAAGLDPALVASLERRVDSHNLGLFQQDPDGRIRPAERVDLVRTIVAPIAVTVLMFMLILMNAPQLMQAVIEEKLSRVSEVLLGSVSPFELMLGKLIGSTGVSLLLALIYGAGGVFAASRLGYAGLVTPVLAASFLGFLVLALFLLGSLYLAIGAACSELKDAQSLMMPVMMLTMVPIFTLATVVEAPASGFAVGLSLFPPVTPFVMLLRMGLHPAPPVWQVGLGVALTIATTIGCVWAAGRIFRVGLLVQGKTPSFGQMVRWVLAK
jgi:ABC-2 type transport system permease protein